MGVRGGDQSSGKAELGIDIIIILLVENYMAASRFDVCVSVSVHVSVYAGGVLKAPQAWKQRVKQWGSFPFRTSRSFLGCSASLERMCWM